MAISKKVRFFYLFLFAVIKKQYKIFLGGLLLGIFVFLIGPKILNAFPPPNKTIKIGLVGQFSTNDIPNEILQELSYGLSSVSEKGEVLPALAENWSTADDGKTYIFKVKTNTIYWHDGKKFSPKDINFNFKDINFSIDGDLLTFKLKELFSPLPTVLSRPIFRKGLIGLGNYKVKKITKNGKFIGSVYLSAFAQKKLPSKIYRFYNNESDLKTAFNLGEINNLAKVFDLNNLYLGPSIKVDQESMTNAYLGVFFNTSNPPFSSKTFRQALAYALAKEKGERRALGPIEPQSWAYNPDVKPYNQDLAKAKSLLEGENIGSQNLKIIISTFPQFEETAILVKENWLKIGIDSVIQIVSAVPETFDVLIIAREIPKDPDQYYYWHSTQPGNISNIKNPRIDKLLEDGRRISDQEQRKSLYFDFQRYLSEESPVVFLSHPVVYNIKRE